MRGKSEARPSDTQKDKGREKPQEKLRWGDTLYHKLLAVSVAQSTVLRKLFHFRLESLHQRNENSSKQLHSSILTSHWRKTKANTLQVTFTKIFI